MTFENPAAFLLIFLIPLLYIFRKLKIFQRVSFPLNFCDWNGKTFNYRGTFSRFLSHFAEFLVVLAFIIIVMALANPVIHHQEKVFTSKGTDILFVLDTSPSMASRDIGSMNRLEAAKLGIKTLMEKERGAGYGLIAMASESAVVVPATIDHEYFYNYLEKLQIGTFGEGTALGSGLCTAIYHLAASSAPKKCIILITDGENNAGAIHPETAAKLASEKSISIYTFGIGTRGTVPIEYIDPKTGRIRSGFYESEFDSAPLEKIAEIGNGKYFGVESLFELSESLSEIAYTESSKQTFFYKSEDTLCYVNFLIVSLALLFSGWFIRRILLKEII